jgi:hypothetical protein
MNHSGGFPGRPGQTGEVKWLDFGSMKSGVMRVACAVGCSRRSRVGLAADDFTDSSGAGVCA